MSRFRAFVSTLAIMCLLATSACASSPQSSDSNNADSTDSDADSAEPPKDPAWGEWVDLGDVGDTVGGANDEYVALLGETGPPHAVYDTSGNKVWDIPDLSSEAPGKYSTYSSDELFIAEVKNGDLVGFNWADGSEKWRLNAQDVLPCDPGDDWMWRLVSRTFPNVDEESVIALTMYTSGAYETECASKGEVPGSIAFDPSTGEEKWRGPNVDVSRNAVEGHHSITGKYVYTTSGDGSAYQLSRTETGSGKTTYASFETSDESTVGFLREVSDKGFIVSGLGPDEYFEVDSWSDSPGGEPILTNPTDDYPIMYELHNSPGTGYVYGFEVGPDHHFDSALKYHLFNVTEPDASEISPNLTDYAMPQAPDYTDDQGGDTYDPYLGNDPIVPRDGKAPLIVLPWTKSKLAAFDYKTGKPMWTVDDGARADHTTYIPSMSEVVFRQKNRVVAVDALTGEEKWAEDFDKPVGALDQAGAFLVATHDGESGASVSIRVIEK